MDALLVLKEKMLSWSVSNVIWLLSVLYFIIIIIIHTDQLIADDRLIVNNRLIVNDRSIVCIIVIFIVIVTWCNAEMIQPRFGWINSCTLVGVSSNFYKRYFIIFSLVLFFDLLVLVVLDDIFAFCGVRIIYLFSLSLYILYQR